MSARVPLFPALAVAVLSGVLTAAAPPQAWDSEVLRHKETVRKASPGPAGTAERSTAINALVRIPNSEAHEFLRLLLEDNPPASDTTQRIVEALRDQVELDLADSKLAVPDRTTRNLIDLYCGYVPYLADLFTPAESGPAGGAVVLAARRILDRLPNPERREEFRKLFRTPLPARKAARKRGAIAAAAECRDLTLAPMLAEFLEHPELGALARESLRKLTFEPDGFATKVAFEAWRKQNEARTYPELQEEAARKFLDIRQRFEQTVSEKTSEYQRRFRQLAGRFVRNLLASANPWTEIHDLIKADDPPGLMVECLSEILAAAPTVKRLPSGTSDASRTVLCNFLRGEFHQRKSVAEKEACLEAYALLSSLGDDRDKRAALDLTMKEAAGGDPAVRRAAIRGLAHFPGDETLARLLVILRDLPSPGGEAADASPTSPSGQTLALFAQGLTTLDAIGVAPTDEKVLAAWFEILDRIANSPERYPDAMRGNALRVLAFSPTEKSLEVLAKVIEGSGKSPSEARIRTGALVWFESVAKKVPGPQGERSLKAAQQFVQHAMVCLTDPDEGLRSEAAALLARFLGETKALPAGAEDLPQKALDAMGQQLLVERSEDAANKMIESLHRLGQSPERSSPAMVRLLQRLALEKEPKSSIVRDRLAETVMNLALSSTTAPADRLQAVQALTNLGDRKRAMAIVRQWSPLDVKDGGRATALEAALSAFVLPAGEADVTPEESAAALTILQALEQMGAPDEKRARLKVEILNRLGRHEETSRAAEACLREFGAAMSPADRESLRFVQGKAYFRARLYREAAPALAEVRSPGPANEEAVELRAEALLRSQQYDEAARAFREYLRSGSSRLGLKGRRVAAMVGLAESLANSRRPEEAAETLRGLTPPSSAEDPEVAARFQAVKGLVDPGSRGGPPSRPREATPPGRGDGI